MQKRMGPERSPGRRPLESRLAMRSGMPLRMIDALDRDAARGLIMHITDLNVSVKVQEGWGTGGRAQIKRIATETVLEMDVIELIYVPRISTSVHIGPEGEKL